MLRRLLRPRLKSSSARCCHLTSGASKRHRERSPRLTTLPLDQLLAQVAEEYVFSELCEAVMLSFAAENEARMRAMIAARTNVERKLDELTASYRNLRQEEITAEIIELSAGTLASTDSRRARASPG